MSYVMFSDSPKGTEAKQNVRRRSTGGRMILIIENDLTMCNVAIPAKWEAKEAAICGKY